MEQAHRDKILNNIEKLIKYTNYDGLMKACLERKLLYDVMQENIETDKDESVRHRRLLQKITHRGPTAYAVFLSILSEKFPDAVEILTHQSYGNGDSNEISIRQSRGQTSINNAAEAYNNGNGNLNATTNCNGNSLIATSNTANTVPQTNLAQNFEPTTNSCTTNFNYNQSTVLNGEIELKIFTEKLTPRHKIDVKLSTQFNDGTNQKVSTYPMKSRNRGVLFLVNIIHFETKKKRKGADVDRNNLITLFQQMGFTVFYYEDLTKDKFLSLVKKLKKSQQLRITDCLVFALLSHGEQNFSQYNVEFSDCEKIEVEDILIEFNNSNCETLAGKPKIFFFPFCRGPIRDSGIRTKTESDNTGASNSVPNRPTFSDMKICYATVPGYNAFRDTTNGSWYIEILCQVFAEHAHDTHLEELLKIMGNSIMQMRTEHNELQTACNDDRGFYRTLYFNPGYYG